MAPDTEAKKVEKSLNKAERNDPLGLEDGYIGRKVDPRPNSEHSLESGPDSPSALEQRKDALEAAVAA